ncbi:hypothetical protein FI667_g8690, partial [Globisporangium splendens]
MKGDAMSLCITRAFPLQQQSLDPTDLRVITICTCYIQEARAWVPHIVTKGNKFFDSVSGLEFCMKGVAYYPRPSVGKLYEVDNYDWVTDDHEAVWKPHLDILQELGVNTIRLYSVDPSKSHDKFMCECSKRGIYVLVGMSAPRFNFDLVANLQGFSVGNENNLQKLSGKQWLQYYDCCVENDEHSRAEWIGFNPYVECDPKAHTKYTQSDGLRGLMKEYQQAEYPQPLMFGEFGCNLGENTIDGFQAQRAFYDAKWMNEEKEMTDQIVGGNVFEFSTERIHLGDQKLTKKRDDGKYGIGYFSPDDCDHGKTPCKFAPYPEFENLKAAYTTTTPSTLTMTTYNATHRKILKCPKQMSIELQPTPTVTPLKCSVAQSVCSGTKANAFKKNPADAIKMGDKKKPSNRDDSNSATDAAKRQNITSNGVRVARSTTGALPSIILAVAALWLMLLS